MKRYLRPRTDDLVALARRARWLLTFRLLVAVAPLLAWHLVSTARTGDLIDVQTATAGYMLLALLTELLRRGGRRATQWVIASSLLVDGAFLVWCVRLIGGIDGPLIYMLVLYGLAITLLASFRSGVKVAAWNSLLLLCLLEADTGGTLGSPLLGTSFPVVDFAVVVTAMWAAALITAAFAAVNERELRRRRYDMQVLRSFAVALENCWETPRTCAELAALATDELLAQRALVVVDSSARAEERRVVGRDLVLHSTTGATGDGAATELLRERPWGPGSVIAEAISSGTTQLLERLDADVDAWLSAELPGAREVVVVPLQSGGGVEGVLAFEHERRNVLQRLFAPGVERRMVSTAEQAAAHAALAISRATLLQQTQRAAQTDGLTGLANRRTFDAALAAGIERGSADGSGCAVALVDLDHFKSVNDTHGHLVGDAVLVALAGCLQTTVRSGDLPARYGGEEFAVIMPGTTAQDAVVVAERLRAAVEAMDAPVPVTASIGVAAAPAQGTASADLLAAADAALYEAKSAGRNRVIGARGSTDALIPS